MHDLINDDLGPMVLNIKSQPILDVLKRFAELHRHFLAGRDIDLPKITLGLESQQQCRGYVLNFSNETVLLVQRQERSDPFYLNYINSHKIVSLQLEWKEGLADLLDLATPLPALEFPSRLELAKKLKAMENELIAKLTNPFSIQVDYDAIQEDTQFAFILNYVSDIVAAIQEIIQENHVCDLFSRSIQRVTIDTGISPAFELHDGRAVFILNFSKGGIGRLSKERIRTSIESVL